jgi:hypothetical protein
MDPFISIYIKDLLLGTPQNFDDAYGDYMIWEDTIFDETGRQHLIDCIWGQFDVPRSDIDVQFHYTEADQTEWFDSMNEQIDAEMGLQISETDWAIAHVMNALIDLGLGEQVNQMVDLVDQLERNVIRADVAVPQIVSILGYGMEDDQ